MVKIGIIGGTGLDNPEILKDLKLFEVKTKFGGPSSLLAAGQIEGVDVVLLSRHGKGHAIMPGNVPNQANIAALKEAGCTHVIATTACGSLKEEIKPGDLIFVDQFIDRTTKRKSTFYEEGRVCHIPMAEPFCANIRNAFAEEARKLNLGFHERGTVITIEGPRFSTRAESNLFRRWGADIINMTTVPEVVLAREAGLHYAAIAISTDYDCWRMNEKAVDISSVLENFRKNVENVKRLILSVVPKLKEYESCTCKKDILSAII
jgi:5'-methylthioadenosine phosphorylase